MKSKKVSKKKKNQTSNTVSDFMQTAPPFVQISCTNDDVVYGLDGTGRVWRMFYGDQGWRYMTNKILKKT